MTYYECRSDEFDFLIKVWTHNYDKEKASQDLNMYFFIYESLFHEYSEFGDGNFVGLDFDFANYIAKEIEKKLKQDGFTQYSVKIESQCGLCDNMRTELLGECYDVCVKVSW